MLRPAHPLTAQNQAGFAGAVAACQHHGVPIVGWVPLGRVDGYHVDLRRAGGALLGATFATDVALSQAGITVNGSRT